VSLALLSVLHQLSNYAELISRVAALIDLSILRSPLLAPEATEL
jgi:hypothetical protein